MIVQIVEDDALLNDGIKMALTEKDMEFTQSRTLQQAKEDFLRETIELIVLDINLPDGSGYEYLKWVRESSNIPVLILTANDLEMDEVMGLSFGADDYMTKPFSLAVLRARIQALCRRIQSQQQEVYKEEDFVFDFQQLRFQKKDVELLLSVNEQKLLRLLVQNKNRVLTRARLVDRLWGDEGEFVDENALSVTINRLRSKLESKEDSATFIQTIYGQGYMWKKKEKTHV